MVSTSALHTRLVARLLSSPLWLVAISHGTRFVTPNLLQRDRKTDLHQYIVIEFSSFIADIGHQIETSYPYVELVRSPANLVQVYVIAVNMVEIRAKAARLTYNFVFSFCPAGSISKAAGGWVRAHFWLSVLDTRAGLFQ